MDADDLEGARLQAKRVHEPILLASSQGLLVASVHPNLRLQVARHVGVLAAKLLRGEWRSWLAWQQA